MRALSKVRPGPGGLAHVEIPVPEPGPGEVRLRVRMAGLCGTDMQIWRDQSGYGQRIALPRVLGHEMVGTVDKLGAGVDGVRVGELVSVESHLPCWGCKACRTGRAHVCARTRYPGVDFDGGFAEFVTVPASIVWVNPPGTPLERASLMEPLGIAVHAALEGSGVQGQTVLVNGCGPIGLMNVAVARHFGASRVIAVEPNALRRRAAEALGADLVLDPSAVDVPAAVRQATAGEGAEVVFEYTGHPDGVRNTFAMVGQLGQVRWCASPSGEMPFNFGSWKRARPTIFNIHGRRLWDTWTQTARLVADPGFDLRPVISHTLPLAEAQSAFTLVDQGQAIKPVIVCG